jgi:NADH:ubiquinone oxidoreductase subunit 3 (subunit A)
MLDDYFRQYGLVAIFAVVALVVPSSMLLVSWLFSKIRIRPEKPDPIKLDIYECGMQTIGGKWGQFNFRYYMYALLFVIFDVQVIFIYPWAVRFGNLGLFALIEMMGFMLVLIVGWVYAWRKHDLEWR